MNKQFWHIALWFVVMMTFWKFIGADFDEAPIWSWRTLVLHATVGAQAFVMFRLGETSGKESK